MTKTVSIKKGVAFIAALVMICLAFAGIAVYNNYKDKAFAADGNTTITLQIGNPVMTVNGETAEIDPGRGTTPIKDNERTMVPIRAIIEALGGEVEWDETTQTVTITFPSGGVEQPTSGTSTEATEPTETAPDVYMTTDISAEGLMSVYEKLGFAPEGNVAVKISTGESPASNYLDPNLIKDLVQSVDGTIVECNTAYGGSRASTAIHKQVAEDHGFTAIADVDIMDEDGSLEIPIARGTTIQTNYVGSHLANYDSLISIAHFKGHAMAGFGGAIKNMSIGIASSEGKSWIHTAGVSKDSPWGGDQDGFCESMAEANSAVVDYLDGKVVYINVMNNLSIDCDCDGNPAAPEMADIGILASTDPVALDQACIDLVYAQKDGGGKSLVERIESRNGLHTLAHAEEIGLGSRTYNLVNIDG